MDSTAMARPTHDTTSAATDSAAPDPATPTASLLGPSDTFVRRHIGPRDDDVNQMLAMLGYDSLEAFIDATIPATIRMRQPLTLDAPASSGSPAWRDGAAGGRGEFELLQELRGIASKNQVLRSCIGMGYHDCITPPVIQRNILENPGWYTQYTPYQAEISQGRLEALLNFQTMVADLTGLPLANASLLDEATAAAEAMAMCHRIAGDDRTAYFAADDCHRQTLAVLRTRAWSMGLKLIVGPLESLSQEAEGLKSLGLCGALVQFPNTFGAIASPDALQALSARLHEAGALLVAAADPLALVLLKPPGQWGADIAVGSTQRFGVPMGGGGPHAAYMATRPEHARRMPGRIVGVSKDAAGNPAFRLAIQTREQHIKRQRATSNICTAQVLLAIMAGMYAVYHGPDGLRRIARRVHAFATLLAEGLRRLGFDVGDEPYFDTLRVAAGRHSPAACAAAVAAAQARHVNLRDCGDGSAGVALDETTTRADVEQILAAFGEVASSKAASSEAASGRAAPIDVESLVSAAEPNVDPALARSDDLLTHDVFNRYHSEHELLRYIHRLEARDLSLTTSMIPLGSCTMKLNATSEMLPITWPQFARMHPFAPADQCQGYATLFGQLQRWLAQITGLPAVSLQPNAGSQGEYAGLLAIRAYHESRSQPGRNVCLIPVSAHGTNPASAVIAGFQVVPVACDEQGNVDVADLKAKAQEHGDRLGALMITYPSTHGVFEEQVRDICAIVHEHGGQVYLDGANLNALVGLCRPADLGADVCHINLHKTFCIPHGGGGPGMGPIAAAEHLATFMPQVQSPKSQVQSPKSQVPSPKSQVQGPKSEVQSQGDAVSGDFGPGALDLGLRVSAAPYGSPSILPISWVYIALMGGGGLTRATQVAMLNANYMARRLQGHFDVLFTGRHGRVAHEFVVDCRAFERSAAVRVEDIAKRLMDYGFHAPTMSWPVPGTLMIEPTESESKQELDRLCDALIAIRAEIRAIEQGSADRDDNALKHAPHTSLAIAADDWPHRYSRMHAAFPAPWLRDHKFWPPVSRIDNVWGDRHLMCTCAAVEAYQG